MQILFIIAVIGVIAWFFPSGTYTTKVKDAESLTDDELEDAYIEIKKQILVTSAFEKQDAYDRLYYRMKAVLGEIVGRHKHFVLDVEAKASLSRYRTFVRTVHHDMNGTPYQENAVRRDLDLQAISPDELLYLCFFLYLGGQAKGVGSIESDPELMLKILDHLIGRDYPAAYFFKGLVMKYGIKVNVVAVPDIARQLLELAQRKGVGAASIELQQLEKYR